MRNSIFGLIYGLGVGSAQSDLGRSRPVGQKLPGKVSSERASDLSNTHASGVTYPMVAA